MKSLTILVPAFALAVLSVAGPSVPGALRTFLLALAVGYVVLGRYVAAYHAPRPVAAGDHLAAIPNLEWNQHRHTLVLGYETT